MIKLFIISITLQANIAFINLYLYFNVYQHSIFIIISILSLLALGATTLLMDKADTTIYNQKNFFK